MTKEMDPNLSPETIKELMGDDVRQYRQRNKKTNVIEIVKASNHYHLPVEEHLRLLNLNDPDNEYSAIPEDKDGKGGDSHDAGHKDNIITFRIPKV